jgi:formylglycine-generating enzyme required for sulfatase activity
MSLLETLPPVRVMVVLVVSMLACSQKTRQAGGLELIIVTDMPTPASFDRVSVSIAQEVPGGGWGTPPLLERDYLIPGEMTLPTTISIAAGSSPYQTVLITLTATKSVAGNQPPEPIVQRVVITQVPTDRLAEMTLLLSSVCAGKVMACPPGESCQPTSHGGVVAGTCGPNVVDPPADETDGGVPSTLEPSCVGLAPTCGRSHDRDCCGANVITGGKFNLGNDDRFPATVSTFRLDNYEVTVGRFRRFVAAYKQTMTPAGAGKNPNNGSDPGWDVAWNASLPADVAALRSAVKCNDTYQTWTDDAGANENQPMNCLDWYEAYAFCIWDGGRLSTDAEWNYASAGGSQQRQFPWGDTTPDCTYANYRGVGIDADYCVRPGTGSTNDVGSESPKGDGYWGQSDLSGNIYEWVEDWYASSYPNPCNDCSNATPASYRVLHGGCFINNASSLVSFVRLTYAPSARDYYVGARCSRSP